MSQAFVKENDEQWLHEVAPTLSMHLLFTLHAKIMAIRVYEKKI